MAGTAAVVAVGAVVGSSVMNARAVKARNSADKKARRIERRISAIENQRQMRRAIAERRMRQAEIESIGSQQGVTGSSSIGGAIGSLNTATAANIGGAATLLAGNTLQADVIGRGYAKAAKLGSQASMLGAIGQAAGSVQSFYQANPNFSFGDYVKSKLPGKDK